MPDQDAAEGQRVLDASALKAYAHPLRVQILRYLADHGRATATELARYLDESTGQTSYHLRQLAKHGLVEDDPTRGTGRERWWKAASFTFEADRMARDPATAPAARMLLNAVVQNRTEALQRWLDDTEAPQEWTGVALHNQSTLVLTTDEVEELNAAVQEVVGRYTGRSRAREQRPVPGAERVRVYYDAFPLLRDDAANAGD